jgi:hypothetical protein
MTGATRTAYRKEAISKEAISMNRVRVGSFTIPQTQEGVLMVYS